MTNPRSTTMPKGWSDGGMGGNFGSLCYVRWHNAGATFATFATFRVNRTKRGV